MSAGEIVAEVVKAIAPVVMPVLVSGIMALGALVGRWLHANTNNSKVMMALATGADYVGSAVAHVVDGIRPDIEKALADDGKISQAEMDQLKSRAIALIMLEMPASLQTVAKNLGPGFQTWLSGKVGQAIQAQVPASPPQP